MKKFRILPVGDRAVLQNFESIRTALLSLENTDITLKKIKQIVRDNTESTDLSPLWDAIDALSESLTSTINVTNNTIFQVRNVVELLFLGLMTGKDHVFHRDGADYRHYPPVRLFSYEEFELTVVVTNSASGSWNNTGETDLAKAINAKLNQIGSNLYDNVYFQFSNGTYVLSETLLIPAFQGKVANKRFYLQGDITETGATTIHETQSVVLDFRTAACDGIEDRGSNCSTVYRNLRILTSGNKTAVKVVTNPNYFTVQDCSVGGDETSGSIGFRALGFHGAQFLRNFARKYYYAYNSRSQSDVLIENSGSAECSYGSVADGATVRLGSGTLPTGTANDTLELNGGEIKI